MLVCGIKNIKLKGALCSNINNINGVIIQIQRYLFFPSEENKVPEHCLKLERWWGPPHINKILFYFTFRSQFPFFSTTI